VCIIRLCMCYLCVYVMSFSHHGNFCILTVVTAICSKVCHLKDENVI
jgi:hypothetical protein